MIRTSQTLNYKILAMLYRSIIFVLFFFTLASAKSQSFFDGFGVKSGLNIATIHESGGLDLDFNLTPKTFFHAGVYKDFWLDLNWSMRAEALYSVKGANGQLLFPGGPETDYYQRAAYLSIPVLAQYARGNFKFGAGPQFGFLLSDNVFLDGEKREGQLYDNSFDLGVAGNITYTLLMIDVDLRYVYGLTPILNVQAPPGSTAGGSNNLHNGVLQLSLGLKIF